MWKVFGRVGDLSPPNLFVDDALFMAQLYQYQHQRVALMPTFYWRHHRFSDGNLRRPQWWQSWHHDTPTRWRHQMETFSELLAFVRGIHRSPLNSPHKGQWRGALMFSLIVRKYSNSQKHIHRHDKHGFGFGYIRVLNGYWFILHIHQGCYMYPDTKSIFGNTSQVTTIVMGGLTDTKPK